MRLVVDQRKLLALPGRLALHVDELRGMRHRLEHDDELRRQLQRQHRLFAGRQLQRIERHLVGQRGERLLVEIDARAPEHLLVIFPQRQRVGIMRGDAPDPRADGEGDLDLLVDGGLVAAGAQAAMIVFGAQRFQRVVGIEHAAAAGTQHVPGQIEQAEPRGMQEARDRLLLVEAGALGKIQRVDAVEFMILAVLDQPRDRIGDRRIGGLLQHAKTGPGCRS